MSLKRKFGIVLKIKYAIFAHRWSSCGAYL